jgi:glucose-6-phosphate isomerase
LSGLRLRAGSAAAVIAARLQELRETRFAQHLAECDVTLWGGDDASRVSIANRLGWVHSAEGMSGRAGEFSEFAREAAAAGFTRVLLLGMGGSSLAPEVLARVHGARPGGLELHVLDDTSPAAVREALAGDPTRTLVLVASKSGGTVEVTSFERAAYARAEAAAGGKPGQAFTAITDPGTALEALARHRGYWRVFTNPADIGGRYSVLSCFGLVPAALLGLDPAALCAEASAELAAFERDGGVALEAGVALGELARAGSDKLTLVLPPEWSALGAWIEQLVAESTGKQGRGILPVDGEPLGQPAEYGGDRVFVAVGRGGFAPGVEARLDALAATGHPVLQWTWPESHLLGGEFLRWELITAVASAVLGVNPFDEPNVSEAKAATQRVLAQVRESGTLPKVAPVAEQPPLALYAPGHLRLSGLTEREWAATCLGLIGPGDYFALLAWMHRTPARAESLDRIRAAVHRSTRAATTLGYGPRYLHSTGQLHKGGDEHGVFLQITADEGDEPIPGETHGFRVLHAAQAAGDYDVLTARGRRVLRVHISGDPEAGLERLGIAFEQATAQLR